MAGAPLPGSPPVPSWVLSPAGEGVDGRGCNPCVEPRGGDVPWAALGRRAARLLLGTGRERFPRGCRVPGCTREAALFLLVPPLAGKGLHGHDFGFVA